MRPSILEQSNCDDEHRRIADPTTTHINTTTTAHTHLVRPLSGVANLTGCEIGPLPAPAGQGDPKTTPGVLESVSRFATIANSSLRSVLGRASEDVGVVSEACDRTSATPAGRAVRTRATSQEESKVEEVVKKRVRRGNNETFEERDPRSIRRVADEGEAVHRARIGGK